MHFYFFIVRLAALFGNEKAKKLVEGQNQTLPLLRASETPSLKGCMWFHVASVGEFEQARPVIERLRESNPQTKILLTFFSPSGYELRKDYDKVDWVGYLPFATRRNAKAFLDQVEPRMAIFVKYEFWPAYLRELQKRKIETWLISAVFRPKQLFFRPWGRLYRQVLTRFSRMFVQDEASQSLLAKYKMTNVEVAGDTRFDRVSTVKNKVVSLPAVEQFIGSTKKVIIGGSTWPDDEALLVRYVEEHEDTKLMLVPHEIDEEHLHRIFMQVKGRCVRYSQATPVNVLYTRVLVVDVMGILSSLYRYGQVAYIGGGFGAGIHNTLEAAVYGMPIVFGPKHEAFREACGLIRCGAAQTISTYNQLEKALDTAFVNQEEMGGKASEYVEQERGATEHIFREIQSFLR